MVDPNSFSDPTITAVTLNLVSSGIASGFNKVADKIFRSKDIEDYLKSISFNETLIAELPAIETADVDIAALEFFFKSDEILNIFAQFYSDSEKSSDELESEFVQFFCTINPINLHYPEGNEKIAGKLFHCIKKSCDDILIKEIQHGTLLAHEYKATDRYRDLKGGQDRIEKTLSSLENEIKTHAPGYIISRVPSEYIDDELKEAITHIEKDEIEEAKTKLLAIKGILETNPKENKKLLSRVYHILAITYYRNNLVKGDFDTAEHLAKRSLELDPSNQKVKGTLASIYISKHGKANFQKSFSIAAPLWEQSEHSNPQFLEIYLWGLFFTKSIVDAITFFESSTDAQNLTKQNDLLSNLIARFYIQNNNPRKGLQYINNSIRLDPNNPDHYAIKASTYREISLKEDYLFSDFEVCPKLKKYDCIEKALKNYQKALSLCKNTTDPLLIERIKKEIYTCASFLNRSNEKEFQKIRFSLNSSQLPENEQNTLEFIDFANELNAYHFSSASQKLLSLKEWEKFSYETKNKFALIFLRRGCPEEAKEILKTLELEAETKQDISFWINMSIVEALLENKNGMLSYLDKAKHASKGVVKWEERVLAHNFGMIHRYQDTGKETDRMLESIKEYDEKFPEQKVLKAFTINENDANPPQEFIDVLKVAHERDQSIKKLWAKHQVPVYTLAEIHKLRYPELMNRLNDPEFRIRYNPPDQVSQNELKENFDSCDILIFDYSSLLNLAKMNLLSVLEKIPKKKIIPKSLFEHIQSDLISYEDPTLRRLWNFLRKPNIISVVDISTDQTKYHDLSKHFDIWVPDLLILSLKNETSIIVSDDYNFIRLIKFYKSKGTITLYVLKFLLEKRDIDSKVYGNAIGILAERMYIILPFDGEDLLHIAMDDNCKIYLRSYHLVNHITFTEISPLYYSRQFEFFIDRLWRSGALFEDKINWLSLIIEKMLFTMNQRYSMRQSVDAILLLYDLKQILKNAVHFCKLPELASLEERCMPLFEKYSKNKLKDFLLPIIAEKKAVSANEDLLS